MLAKRGRKLLSLLLALSMCVGMVGISVSAVEGTDTPEGKLICPLTEHTHTDTCYEKVLICGQGEIEGHTHTDTCYDSEGSVICGQDESEGHTHTDACYGQSLVCSLTEHIHSAECYSTQSPVDSPDFSEEDPNTPNDNIPSDPEGDPPPSENSYIAQIGADTYETLQAAINAAPQGEIVTLAANTAEDITINQSITLNLDGWTLTGTTADTPVITVGSGVSVTIQDGTITGKVSNSTGSQVTGIILSQNSYLTLDNCIVTGCQAKKTASAIIRAEGGALVMTGGVVQNCTQDNGGNIVLAQDCAVTLNGVQFLNNTAMDGAVALAGTASLDMDGCTFRGNSTSYSTSDPRGTLQVLSSGNISVADTTFEASTGTSAAIYVNSPATAESPMLIDFTNVTVSGYTASNDVIYVTGTANITAEELQLTGNTTNGSGAILRLDNTGTNSLTGCTISGNQAKTGASGGNTITIGASARTSFTSCNITSNTSGANAAGINVASSAEVTLNSCLISGNRVENTNNSAGGLYVGSNATVTVIDTVIKENRRTGSNSRTGGVYVNSGAIYTMTGGALYSNINENGGNANDLYSFSAYVTLPEASGMEDGDVSFGDYQWMNNGNPLAAAPDGTTKTSYNLAAKIYSTKNVQIIRNGEPVGEPYNTVMEARNAAQSGDTLKLVSPMNEVSAGNERLGMQGKDLTLDLNGHTLTCPTGTTKAVFIVNGGNTLTIEGTGVITNPIYAGEENKTCGHLVLEGNVQIKQISVYGTSNSNRSTVVVDSSVPMDQMDIVVEKYGTVDINSDVNQLQADIAKYADFTIKEGVSVGTLTISQGDMYVTNPTSVSISGTVDNLTLSQYAKKEGHTAYLNAAINVLTLTHQGSYNPETNARENQVIAGENFSVGSLTYKASYLSKDIVGKYSTAGNGNLPDIPFLSGVDEGDVDLSKADWTISSSSYLGTDKDLTTIQLDENGNLVLRYAPYSGDVYLGGNGDDSNSGMVPSSSVQSLSQALALLAAVGEDAEIIVTDTVNVDETIDVSGVTFRRYPTLKNALFDITGTVTMTNVTVDGAGISAQEPLIDVRSGGVLNIETDTVLTGGVNTGTISGNAMGSSKGEGGAIRTSGTVNMNDGEISGNRAYAGGGVLVLSGGALNLNSGEISSNHATGAGSVTAPSGGGAVLVARSGIMNMSGGTISNNTSADVGGGITLGGGMSSAYVDTTSHPTLNMTGGIISYNTSDKEGGGLHVQVTGVANVSAGEIINNESKGGLFSGGGIYVNGGFPGFDNGLLNLTNVWLSGNTADEGGGISACPTSTVRLYLNNGGVIWGNHDTSGEPDDIKTVAIISDSTGKTDTAKSKGVYISRYMMGGELYQWTRKADGSLATGLDLVSKQTHIYSAASAETAGAQMSKCSVIITGNSGFSRGGGIGTNGDVIIGVEDANVEYGTVKVNKNWEPIEGVDMSEEVYQKLFSVTFDLYYRVKGSDDEWTLLDTKSSNLQTDFTSWETVNFTDLMMTDEQGTEYEYKVEERTDDRYTRVGDPEVSTDRLTWTFTNTPAYSLKVAKLVVDSYDVAQNETFTFRITLSDTDGVTAVDQDGETVELTFVNGTAVVELAGNEFVLLSGLKHDTTYTVTEDADPNYTQSITLGTWQSSSNYQTEAVTKVKDQALVIGTNTVTFTNTTKEPTGNLTITKTVTGSGSTTDPWNFTVELFLDDGLTQPMPQKASGKPAYSFAYTVTNADGTQAAAGLASIVPEGGDVTFNGAETIVLTSGQSVTVSGIPAGIWFRVNEQEANANGYTTTVTLNGNALQSVTAAGSIQKNEAQLVAYTNNLPDGGTILPPDTPDPDPTPTPDPDPEPTPDEDIPDEDVPQTDVPDEPTPDEDIPDEDVPQTDVPAEDIPEEDVPMADAPETGDTLPLWIALCVISGAGLAGVTLLSKKRKDEDA